MLDSSRIVCGALCLITGGFLAVSPAVEPIVSGPSIASTPQIAFASKRDGNWEIYVSDADGQRQTRLTRRDTEERFPLWSPDRSQIAFGAEIGGNHWELWVMNADGTKPRFLATQIVAKGHRQWSRDGKRIVFAAKVDGNDEIMSVEVASGRLTQLTRSAGDDGDPTLSPDNTQIAFYSTRDGNAEIYVMRADGTQPRRLTNNPAPDRSPDWSPDGSKIAFISASQNDVRDVFLVRPDGGDVERLTTGAHATNDGSRWSPDGSYIAVQSSVPSYDIHLVRMTNRERKVLAGTPVYDGLPHWSPAGDQIVFISARDGLDALYTTDLMGNVKRLTTTPTLSPAW